MVVTRGKTFGTHQYCHCGSTVRCMTGRNMVTHFGPPRYAVAGSLADALKAHFRELFLYLTTRRITVKSFAAQYIFSLFAMLSAAMCFADDKMQKSEDFKPYKLAGDWKFVNSNTGVKYGGDVEVVINNMDSKGVLHGRISYDGRQTNDKCGTKALFTDKPVEAEIIKTNEGYRVTYEVPCSIGVSPRVFSRSLACTDHGICSQPEVLPWGKGVLSLTEKR